MTCCKRDRVKAGLECSIERRTDCAGHWLVWAAQGKPELVERVLESVLVTLFGETELPSHCREALVPQFANACALLATKAERRAFRARLQSVLNSTELDQFDCVLSAQWHRLRGVNEGSK